MPDNTERSLDEWIDRLDVHTLRRILKRIADEFIIVKRQLEKLKELWDTAERN